MKVIPRHFITRFFCFALFMCLTSTHPGIAVATSDVPLQFQFPSNPEHNVRVSKKDRTAITRTLSGYRDIIANAEIVMRGFDVNPYMTENHTDRMAEFSVCLTLTNGSSLSTKRHKVPAQKIRKSIQECIHHCIRRYHNKTGGDDCTINLTNL